MEKCSLTEFCREHDKEESACIVYQAFQLGKRIAYRQIIEGGEETGIWDQEDYEAWNQKNGLLH